MSRFTFYAASFWHRYGEPDSVAVIMQSPTWGVRDARKALEKAIEEAIREEIERCTDVPDDELIEPDICWSGIGSMSVKELFTAAELREHRQVLQSGEVVWMSQG